MFLGKPAGMVLAMDSVGGMEVAARLLVVLNLLGCTVPPLAAVVLSRVGLTGGSPAEREDVYQVADVDTLVSNLLLAARRPQVAWHAWRVTPTQQPTGRFSGGGALDIDQPPWPALPPVA